MRRREPSGSRALQSCAVLLAVMIMTASAAQPAGAQRVADRFPERAVAVTERMRQSEMPLDTQRPETIAATSMTRSFAAGRSTSASDERSWWRYPLIGLGAGAVVGAAVGISTAASASDDPIFNPYLVVGFPIAAGAATGALIGGIVEWASDP